MRTCTDTRAPLACPLTVVLQEAFPSGGGSLPTSPGAHTGSTFEFSEPVPRDGAVSWNGGCTRLFLRFRCHGGVLLPSSSRTMRVTTQISSRVTSLALCSRGKHCQSLTRSWCKEHRGFPWPLPGGSGGLERPELRGASWLPHCPDLSRAPRVSSPTPALQPGSHAALSPPVLPSSFTAFLSPSQSSPSCLRTGFLPPFRAKPCPCPSNPVSSFVFGHWLRWVKSFLSPVCDLSGFWPARPVRPD